MLNLRKHLKEAEWKALAERERAIATLLNSVECFPDTGFFSSSPAKADVDNFEKAKAALNRTGHSK